MLDTNKLRENLLLYRQKFFGVEITLRKILLLFVIFTISLITMDGIPVGALCVFFAAFAAGYVMFPIVAASVVAVSIVNWPSLLIYVLMVAIFVAFTILLKPLELIENRAEKKKCGTYVVVTSSIMYIFTAYSVHGALTGKFGISWDLFWYGLTMVLIMYGVYKLLVNVLPTYYSEPILEMPSIYQLIASIVVFEICLMYWTYILNIPQDIVLGIFVLTTGVLAYKKGLIPALVQMIFSIFLGMFLITTIPAYYLLVTALIFWAASTLGKPYNFVVLALAITIGFIFAPVSVLTISYILATIYLIPDLLASNEFRFKSIFSLGKEEKLFLPKAVMIEKLSQNTPLQIQMQEIFLEDEYQRLFEQQIIMDERLKQLSIYNVLVYNDSILLDIYKLYVKKNYESFDVPKLQDILNSNNIIFDFNDPKCANELEILNVVYLEYFDTKKEDVQKLAQDKMDKEKEKEEKIRLEKEKLKKKIKKDKEDSKDTKNSKKKGKKEDEQTSFDKTIKKINISIKKIKDIVK